MKHDCRIGYLETSEDDEGYLYIEWKRVYGSNTGKFKVEYCPVCGMKAKKSGIEHLALFERTDLQVNQLEAMHKHVMDIFKSCCDSLINETLKEHEFKFCHDSIRHTLEYMKARRGE